MDLYSSPKRITVKTLFGLEDVLKAEVEALGIDNVAVHSRAVSFLGGKREVYLANYALHTALRVLVPIKKFKARDPEELYKHIKNIPWEVYLDEDMTFAIDAVVHSNYFTHSKYAALKSKDGLVDRLREKFRKRPSVDVDYPHVAINLHIWEDEVTVSLDSSGESLHKRGYKSATNAAPLNEVLAAGMIFLTGWDGKSALIDGMCGSGTLLTEAALIATKTPPGAYRNSYCFLHWKDFDSALWSQIREEMKGRQVKCEAPLFGNEISRRVLAVAKENVERLNLGLQVMWFAKDFLKWKNPEGPATLLLNPPYGERMEMENIEEFYAKVGDKLKKDYEGYEAWMITANREGLKNVGLRTSKRINLLNGKLECSFVKYEMYSGTRKVKSDEV